MRRSLAWVALAIATVAGCRCEELVPITELEGTFRADPRVIDFGRVLEGNTETRTVQLISSSRYSQTVVILSAPPFIAPQTVELPAGGQVTFEIAFEAHDTVAEADVALAAGASSAVVHVRGEGVRPLICRASAPCRVSTFDLESNSCVETLANDGLPCDSENQCVENGACHAGVCEGDVRTCDDLDACTDDLGCSPELGCLHRRRRCPRPANPCLVAVCDSQLGCGTANAPDFTSCGDFTCVEGRFCVTGHCVVAPTPEGFLCAPPSPCQAEGTCRAQECVRPDAGSLAPTFSLEVPAGPAEHDGGDPEMVAVEGNVFVALCDGGCALASWTSNGFERFTTSLGDDRIRRVLGGTAAGVWVHAGDSLELYDATTGARVAGYPLALWAADGGTVATVPAGFAVTTQGALWLTLAAVPPEDAGTEEFDAGELDGGGDAGSVGARLVLLPPDGGEAAAFELSWSPPQLALDELDRLYAYAPGDGVRALELDAGVMTVAWSTAFDGGSGLAVGLGQVLVGGDALLEREAGAIAVRQSGAGAASEPVYLDGEWVLLTPTAAFVLYRSCTTPFTEPCAENEKGLWVRSYAPGDGGVLWQAQVLSPEGPGSVEAMVNVDGGVALLTQRSSDAGDEELRLQGFFDGDEYLSCPLEGGGHLGAAVFDGRALYLLRSRDGGWSLDGYDFAGAPLDFAGWGARGSAGGARRGTR